MSGLPGENSAETVAEPAAEAVVQEAPGVLPASLSHRVLTLIAGAFLSFEFLFVILYASDFWLDTDIRNLGLPVMVVVVVVAHLLLRGLESNFVSRRVVYPIFKGRPAIFYERYVTASETGIKCGIRHINWEAIDEVEQTWFGNLVIKSRIAGGDPALPADVVLKFPYTGADPAVRKKLIEYLKYRRPEVKLNDRLVKGLESVFTASSQYTQLMTAGFMALVLVDLGYSSFYYLEVVKQFYLAELDARAGKRESALKHMTAGDDLRTHPLPISWLTDKFFLNATANAADMQEQRGMVLWFLGKHDEAIAASKKAMELSPKILRRELRQARMLAASGKPDEAREQLKQALEDHESALLARLYLLSLDKDANLDKEKLREKYKEQLDICYESTFGEEPRWPPIKGDNFFHELIYSEDLRFVMDRLLDLKPDPGGKDWYEPPKDIDLNKKKPQKLI